MPPDAHLRARLLRRFRQDDRGVASIMGALLMVLGLGLAILVIDAGHLYLAKRRLQAAVDAAALAAAGDAANATTLAAISLGMNGYDTTAVIVTGGYSPDPALAADARFDPNAAAKNAVRVTKTITTPQFFAGVLGTDASATVAATATAARVPGVAFAAGTGLASLSGGQLNQVLGGLTGTTLSLSLVNYQALANANVDILAFLNQLAAQAGVTAGTYGDLANASVSMGQVLAAAKAALNLQPGGGNTAALDALNLLSLQMPAGVSATLRQAADTSLWQTRRIGSIVQQDPGIANFNLFDLVAAMARVYGAGHLAALNSAITLPITGTSTVIRLTLGSPMTSVGLSPVGTTLNTAQVRLAFVTTAANVNLGAVTATLTLPVYLSIASGQATASALPCAIGGTRAVITAQSQAGAAQIGTVSDSDLKNFSAAPAVGQATVATITLLGIPVAIKASGAITIAGGTPTALTFTQADIDARTAKTAAGSDAGAVFTRLANSMTLTTSFTGGALTGAINSTLNTAVLPLVKSTLVSILVALDPASDTLLRTLGLRLGAIDVVVRGVRCGAPVLVH